MSSSSSSPSKIIINNKRHSLYSIAIYVFLIITLITIYNVISGLVDLDTQLFLPIEEVAHSFKVSLLKPPSPDDFNEFCVDPKMPYPDTPCLDKKGRNADEQKDEENMNVPVSKLLLLQTSSSTSDHQNSSVCSNNSNPVSSCYRPECFIPLKIRHHRKSKLSSFKDVSFNKDLIGKGCQQPNPFFREPQKTASSSNQQQHEYTCSNRKSDIKPSVFTSSSQSSPLQRFKERTSWMFSKWYDWGGKCHQITGSSRKNIDEDDFSQFVLSGAHHREDGLYHLKNVCLRPNGGLAGYFPLVDDDEYSGKENFVSDFLEPYFGTDDVAYVSGERQTYVINFLSNDDLHKRLDMLELNLRQYLDERLRFCEDSSCHWSRTSAIHSGLLPDRRD